MYSSSSPSQVSFWVNYIYTPGSSNIAGWKMGAPDWVDVFPIKKMGNIPAIAMFASFYPNPDALIPWQNYGRFTWIHQLIWRSLKWIPNLAGA